MQFSDIIGQAKIKKHLVKTVSENRISHAQLFLGSEGSGTLPLALAYAKYIMCLNRQDNEPCQTCSACVKVEKMQHPDLHFVFPVVTLKSKNKSISDTFINEWRTFLTNNPYGSYNNWLDFINSGNSQAIIRVDEGTDILRKLSMKAFESEYKIMIIWYPEKMNTQTANKLLKLIEEPPEKTIFLLVAQSSEYILPTILSRTQLIKVPRITDNEFFIDLQEKQNIDQERAKQISRLAEGDYLKAIEFIETSEDTIIYFENFTQMMRLSYTAKFIELIQWVDSVSKLGREKQKIFLNYCIRMIRENLVLNQKLNDKARLLENEEGFAKNFSKFIHPQNAPILTSELNKAYMHIVRNANAKVVFLDLCFKLSVALKKQMK